MGVGNFIRCNIKFQNYDCCLDDNYHDKMDIQSDFLTRETLMGYTYIDVVEANDPIG